MKEKDLPTEPHYAIMEFESSTNYNDDWASTIDHVNYETYQTVAELEAALAARFARGRDKTYRVVKVEPMEVTVKAVANVKPATRSYNGAGTII